MGSFLIFLGRSLCQSNWQWGKILALFNCELSFMSDLELKKVLWSVPAIQLLRLSLPYTVTYLTRKLKIWSQGRRGSLRIQRALVIKESSS